MTSIARVAIPAPTPVNLAIGSAKSAATRVAKPAPARIASSGLSCAGKTQEESQCGIVRNWNPLSAVGIVRSAEKYAPIATKVAWPKESTPELPLKICSASTTIRLRNIRTPYASYVVPPKASTSAQVTTSSTASANGGQSRRP